MSDAEAIRKKKDANAKVEEDTKQINEDIKRHINVNFSNDNLAASFVIAALPMIVRLTDKNSDKPWNGLDISYLILIFILTFVVLSAIYARVYVIDKYE